MSSAPPVDSSVQQVQDRPTPTGDGSPSSPPAGSARRWLLGRTPFVLVLLAWLVVTTLAFLQPPHADAYRTVEPGTSLSWWLYPRERNAFLRLPLLGGIPMDAAIGPRPDEGWVVGTRGLIAHTTDRGRTWEHIPFQIAAASETQSAPPIKKDDAPRSAPRSQAAPANSAIVLASWAPPPEPQPNNAARQQPITKGEFRDEVSQLPSQKNEPNAPVQSPIQSQVPPAYGKGGSNDSLGIRIPDFVAVGVRNGRVTFYPERGRPFEAVGQGSQWQIVPAATSDTWSADDTASKQRQRAQRLALLLAFQMPAAYFLEVPSRLLLVQNSIKQIARISPSFASLSDSFAPESLNQDSDEPARSIAILESSDAGKTWKVLDRLLEGDPRSQARARYWASISRQRLQPDGIPEKTVAGQRLAVWHGQVLRRLPDSADDAQPRFAPGPTLPYARFVAPWYYVATFAMAAFGVMIRLAQDRHLHRLAKAPRAGAPAWIEGIGTSDNPIGPDGRDVLNLGARAQAMANFLRNPRTTAPLTIAVEGAWGSGKSSYMRLLKARLDQAGFSTVEFNAWHHQTEEKLLGALLEHIRDGAAPEIPGQSLQTFYLSLRFRARLWAARFSKQLEARPVATLALIALCSFSVFMLVFRPDAAAYAIKSATSFLTMETGSDASPSDPAGSAPSESPPAAAPAPDAKPKGWKYVLGNGLLGVLAAITGLIPTIRNLKSFGMTPTQLAAAVTKGSEAGGPADLSMRAKFAAQLREVTDALGPDRRMVIFIDDMDRCDEHSVSEMLSAMNYLVTAAPLVLVAAFDRAHVKACIQMNFGSLITVMAEVRAADGAEVLSPTRFADNFLEKLVQLREPIPTLGPDQAALLLDYTRPLPLSPTSLAAQPPPPSAVRAARNWCVRCAPALLTAASALGGVLLAQSSWFTIRDAAGPAPGEAPITAPGLASPAPDAFSDSLDSFARQWLPEELYLAAPTHTFTWSPGLLLVLLAAGGALLFLLVLSRAIAALPSPTTDSDELTRSLSLWGTMLGRAGRTPRSVKRLLNRIRLGAARQEVMNLPFMDAPYLVALAVVEELDPAALVSSSSLNSFLNRTPTPAKTGAEHPELKVWPADQAQIEAAITSYRVLVSGFRPLDAAPTTGAAAQLTSA